MFQRLIVSDTCGGKAAKRHNGVLIEEDEMTSELG